jgi:two-component system KDP operon response regulator KdpE
MRVALRKQVASSSEPVFQSGGLSVDFSRRVVTVDEREIQLTPTEYDLLKVFVTYAGKVITHHQLLRQVWGEGYDDMHILRVNISNLRSKLEPDPSRPTYIRTEPGVGYRLKV